MTHPSPEELESFGRRTLPRRELLAVDAHVAACEACRRLLSEKVDNGAAARRAFEAVQGGHPAYEEIEGYVDRRISAEERAIIAEHAALCDACAREIEGLEEFRSGHRGNWRWWAVAAAAAAALFITILALRSREAHVVPPSAPLTASTSPSTGRPAEVRPPGPSVDDPLQSLSPSLRGVALALESGTLPSAALLSSLQPPSEQQRTTDVQDAAAIRVAYPVGIVVETDRPSFRWERADAGPEVTVQVYDRNYRLVAESPRWKGSSWQVPDALDRGATYRWQLRLHDDQNGTVPSPPDPPALFHVVGRKSFDELTLARKSGTELEVGLICIREGLVAEGAESLAHYAAEHPESAVATRISESAAALQERAVTATSKQGRTATSSTGD